MQFTIISELVIKKKYTEIKMSLHNTKIKLLDEKFQV